MSNSLSLLIVDDEEETIYLPLGYPMEPSQLSLSVAVPSIHPSVTETEIAPSELDLGECTHPYVTGDGACATCGCWTGSSSNYMEGMKPRRHTARTITKDIRNYPLGDDIKLEADNIYSAIISTNNKKKQKKMVIFYCLFQAHIRLGQPVDPSLLGNIVGIPRNKISKAISYYNTLLGVNSQHQSSYISPVDLIPKYCDKLRLDDSTTANIIEEFQAMLEKVPALKDKPPRTTVAAFLHYYMETHGVKVDDQEFADLFTLSFGTIKTMKSKISLVDNM